VSEERTADRVPTSIGFLHPGAMGASIAAVCTGERLWVGDGRSAASRRRAEQAGMIDVGSLPALVERSQTIVSVCPPASAIDVARSVAALGHEGVFVDANAVAPGTAREIGEMFEHFVDGGIVGPPVRSVGSTRLYLSGDAAAAVARPWADSALEVRIVAGGAGAASAVKMCFAAWTKGTSALLLAIRALATAEGVDDALLAEWATSLPHLAEQSRHAAATTAPKGWRFAGEMLEIAASFAAHDLPDGFGLAAADVYERLAEFKDSTDAALPRVIAALSRQAAP
jgi:3-hydroxyisobutyrate dehydrogenase-like beta-hydroxyacid dehydrogenase